MIRQPTLLDVPRILLRAVAGLLARIIFLLAGVTFLATCLLLWLSLLFGTYRVYPNDKTQAAGDLVRSVVALLRTFGVLRKTPNV